MLTATFNSTQSNGESVENLLEEYCFSLDCCLLITLLCSQVLTQADNSTQSTAGTDLLSGDL